MAPIIKVSDREKLKPRREPYFHRVAAGQYLGIRVQTSGSPGSWIGRWRNPDTGLQHYKALGTFERWPASERFDVACKAACEWFDHITTGGSTETFTIKDACDRYVLHLHREKGAVPANDAGKRFERHVFDNARFAATTLDQLKASHITVWKNRLRDKPAAGGTQRTDASINRDMTTFRAALNLARHDGLIATDKAWRTTLTPIKNAGTTRDVYLDRDQRRALINAAPPDLAQFIRGMCAVPLRPGALAGLTAGSFDPRLAVLTIAVDKSGRDRKITLPASTAAIFIAAATGKPPTAPLFARDNGMAWDKDAWKHPFKAAAEKATLPSETTMYVLRHSAITDLVHGGLDLATVAQISGTSVRMIEAHYAHLRSDIAAIALEGLAL